MTSRLDGAGQLKMAALEGALEQVQRLYALVERFAVAARSPQEAGIFRQQIQRTANPLVGQLRQQFEPIADQLSKLILLATRPGNEQARVRSLREAVAQIRLQIEASMVRVREQHREADDASSRGAG